VFSLRKYLLNAHVTMGLLLRNATADLSSEWQTPVKSIVGLMSDEMFMVARRFVGINTGSIDHDQVLWKHNDHTAAAVLACCDEGSAAFRASVDATAGQLLQLLQLNGAATSGRAVLVLASNSPSEADGTVLSVASQMDLHARIGNQSVDGLVCSCSSCQLVGRSAVPQTALALARCVGAARTEGVALATWNRYHSADLRVTVDGHKQLPPSHPLRQRLDEALVAHWRATLLALCALLEPAGVGQLTVVNASGSACDFGLYYTEGPPRVDWAAARLSAKWVGGPEMHSVPGGAIGGLPRGFLLSFGVAPRPGLAPSAADYSVQMLTYLLGADGLLYNLPPQAVSLVAAV
jgi:hypothetical protein